MNNQSQTTTYDWIRKLPGEILALATISFLVWFAFYVLRTFKKIKAKEVEIFAIKDEIDNLEQTILNKRLGISQGVLDKSVAVARKPLEAKFEKLKMERQFLLDRVSIFGLIKK